MSRTRALIAAVVVVWAIAVPPAQARTTAASRGATPAVTSSADTCSVLFQNDPRLGPASYPTMGPVHFVTLLYNRFGLLSEQQFLQSYWDPSANSGRGGWRYPPSDGFLVVAGGPVEAVATLVPGTQVDRFGSEFGAFLAPAGTLYTERGIPPQSLDTADPAYPCNYHLYQVTKPFKVLSGPIAPWFGQLGLGVQDKLDPTLLPGAPTPLSVGWLVTNGYLARLN